MTPSDILTQVRYITKTSTSDGTGDETKLLPILNDYFLRQVVAFVNTNEDKFGIKATTDLNPLGTSQESYALPTDLLRLKRAEITYDGSNWRKIHTNDDGEVQNSALDATSINQNYTTSDPYADIYGDTLYLRPIPNAQVTAGLRIWYIQRPSLISSLSAAITTPIDYHGYLIYGVAAEVATRQGNETLAASMFTKWNDGLQKIKDTFTPQNLDQLIDFKPLPVNYY